ncbi:hypothetical protein [Aquiflexum gelatinilyticum]|uniref:Transcription elongation factor n=1 Tax=Aquiflexum gelatinilyticum TaxID=2961943 RepID=A0A9X2P4F5_9BACT|nr:hypothetical protein [Aquiflexum gelatinilyticum]MCR9015821.1 hypothetical protein [Aquiflexum gelatinilyticum]
MNKETSVLNIKHTAFKKALLEAAINKHQSVIDDFQNSIREMIGSENEANQAEPDLSQQGFNSEQIHRANAVGDQVSFANREMEILQNMLPTIEDINDTVKLGSVVVTDKDIFFVSTSIERMKVNGYSVFGLSTESPIYQVMKGKKQGESFSFKVTQYRIKEIF